MKPPDGGWSWVVCLASFLANGVTSGIINSFGVLYIAILEETGASAFQTSWIGSICSGLNFLMAPLASVLVDKLGCRPTAVIGGTLSVIGILSSSFVSRIEIMYVTYGVLTGIGFGLSFQPALVVLGVYFKNRLGLANGLSTFGASVFTMSLPYIMRRLLDVGLAPCLWFQAALTFMMLIGAFTFRPLPQDTQRTSHEGEYSRVDKDTGYEDCVEMSDKEFVEMSSASSDVQQPANHPKRNMCRVSCGKTIDFSIWSERNYRIWTIGLITGCFGYFVPFFHLIKHVNDTIPDAPAEVLIMCLGAASGVGRLVAGYISDHPKVFPVYLQLAGLIVIGTCTIIVPAVMSFPGLCVLVLLMGFFDGAFIATFALISFSLVGPKRASQGLGVILGILAFPLMIGPPVAGVIYDHMGTYNIAFISFGALAVIGGSILFLIRPEPERGEEPNVPSGSNDLPQDTDRKLLDGGLGNAHADKNAEESDRVVASETPSL